MGLGLQAAGRHIKIPLTRMHGWGRANWIEEKDARHPLTPHDAPERDTWLRTLYGLAQSNIRWAKEQGWRVVGWYLALLGGILTLYKYLLSSVPLWVFVKLTIVLTLIAAWFLWRLNEAARSARATSIRIESTLPENLLPASERSVAGGQYIFLALQWLVLLVTCVLVIMGLIHIHTQPTPVNAHIV